MSGHESEAIEAEKTDQISAAMALLGPLIAQSRANLLVAIDENDWAKGYAFTVSSHLCRAMALTVQLGLDFGPIIPGVDPRAAASNLIDHCLRESDANIGGAADGVCDDKLWLIIDVICSAMRLESRFELGTCKDRGGSLAESLAWGHLGRAESALTSAESGVWTPVRASLKTRSVLPPGRLTAWVKEASPIIQECIDSTPKIGMNGLADRLSEWLVATGRPRERNTVRNAITQMRGRGLISLPNRPRSRRPRRF